MKLDLVGVAHETWLDTPGDTFFALVFRDPNRGELRIKVTQEELEKVVQYALGNGTKKEKQEIQEDPPLDKEEEYEHEPEPDHEEEEDTFEADEEDVDQI